MAADRGQADAPTLAPPRRAGRAVLGLGGGLRVRPYAASVRAHSETVLRSFYDFCAMRRSVISPAQRGEMGGISLDPMAYPAPKGNTGTIACQETSGHAQAYGVTR